MYGLRMINNNYVAAGDGRDLVITYDADFRGGRLGSAGLLQFLPKPQSGPSQARRPMTVGFNARTEGYTQKLNCSRSSSDLLREKKERILDGLSSRPETPALEVAALQVGHTLARTMSDFGTRSFEPFRHRWESRPEWASTEAWTRPTVQDEERRPRKVAARPPQKDEPWLEPSFVPVKAGWSRTAGGGFWPH